jgi:hypothetical protein
MTTYSLIVGNIGTIDCESRKEAYRRFREYVEQSKETSGRASGESVTLLKGDTILKEYTPKPKYPTIGEIRSLLVSLKSDIHDDYRSDDDGENDTPSMCVTIGWSDVSGNWSYQTGDNSFTGGAYHYPHWAVITLDRRSNSTELARDIINQLADLAHC